MYVVLIPVGSDVYALPVDWVRQVVPAPPLTALPTAPSVVLGLFNLRGAIVPLFDTAVLLGVGNIEMVAFAVVVGSTTGLAGLATTAVPERVSLDTPATGSELPGTAGTFCVDGRVVVLLDPGSLLTMERLGRPAPSTGPMVPVKV